MYNNGNSSKNVTGASVVDGTLENADYADNGLSGDKIDGGIISNFQSTGIDDRLPTGKILTLSTTGIDVTGSVTCDNDITVRAGNPIINITSDNTGQGKIKFGGTTDPDAGIVAYSDNDDSMRFTTNNTEKLRILSSGGITFNGDTAAANALDDYEEGTWTPAWTNGAAVDATYTAQVGYYTKIGNKVHIEGNMTVSALGTITGGLRIIGLPFSTNAGSRSTIQVGYGTGLAITAGTNISGYSNVTYFLMRIWNVTTGTTNFTDAMLSADGGIFFSADYIV